MGMSGDQIQFSQVKIDGRFGVSDRERAREQTVLVDMDLTLDFARAAATDDPAETVAYSEVVRTIQAVADGGEHRLMETYAHECAAKILESYPQVQTVAIRVRKPQPASPGQMAWVGVEIQRSR
jgi:dihydroneopterin aldolase